MERSKVKTFVSWSGGKDAALSFYRAMGDFQVTCLLNMVTEDGRISRSHGIRTDVLRMQAEAMGIQIIQQESSWETYEAEFKKALSGLKGRGVEAGIFGDIDLDAHREWVERVSRESGMEAVLPLWGEKNREKLIEELIEAGFETIVVATKKDVLGPEWLGRRIDYDFVRDISKIKGVDISGEGGEYHTFVVSGPIFKKRINILKSKKIIRDQHCFLDILECELAEKL
ncbi:MAG: diphthine--ammonia ligase [Proteobacteria bacterium]|nr:diphthine--ammonia ligase [Pseudomonadota bacterium]MBU4067398.1 diphthine--ammonia ligase [Pseudomonadota bacterium]MBU4127193.1 diphthine--ammonia ligase [Pseudomonadota bacterium]